jgi:hypothetical protein
MRLRNSFGRESSASSTTLTKCSRFIFTHRSPRVAVVIVAVIIVIFFAVPFVFLFVFFLVWLLLKDDIDNTIRRG